MTLIALGKIHFVDTRKGLAADEPLGILASFAGDALPPESNLAQSRLRLPPEPYRDQARGQPHLRFLNPAPA